MNLSDLAAWNDAKLIGSDPALPLIVKADSRQILPGEAFVAVPGTRVDGHRYIDEVLALGASVIIAEEDKVSPETIRRWPDRTFLLVKGDSSHGLASLAAARRKKLPNLKEVVAITGSVGKTTAKNDLYQLLQKKYRCSCAQGNYNTLIGCAMALLAAGDDTEILILEMGANHQGEIAEMVRYYEPTLVAITEASPVHIEGFGSLEGIIRAKCEILESPLLKSAVVNGDNAPLMAATRSLAGEVVQPFGSKGVVSFRNARSSWMGDHFQVKAVVTGMDGISFSLSLPLAGIHQLYPLCCAIALAGLCGLTTQEAAGEIDRCRPLAGRGKIVIASSGAAIIDESYNASPVAMAASLQNLAEVVLPGRVFLVLGEMLELGEATLEEHQKLFAQASAMDALIFLFGAAWRSIPGAEKLLYQSQGDLIDAIEKARPQRGDLILVKGSQGNHLGEVVRALEL